VRVRRAQHQDPPDVAWLAPELDVGAEPELKPLELEPVELEPVEPEEPELEEPELEEPVEPVELEGRGLAADEPEFAEVEPVDVLEWCVEPGRARASAPAVTTLAMPTAVVAERTLSRPRSLAAMARRMPSRCSLLMSSILRSGIRSPLRGTSPSAMRRSPRLRPRGYPGNMKDT
jgi:hypothetical protein